jgi:ribosomal protein S3
MRFLKYSPYFKPLLMASIVSFYKGDLKIIAYMLGYQLKLFGKTFYRVLKFIKKLFNILRFKQKIKGLRLIVKGRIGKRNRTKTFRYSFGSIPLNTVSSKITYGESFNTSKYGLFSTKIWLFQK